MNKERRKEIAAVIADVEQCQSLIRDIHSEEQDFFDNMPESFREGEKGERADAVVNHLDTAITNLDEAIEELHGAVE